MATKRMPNGHRGSATFQLEKHRERHRDRAQRGLPASGGSHRHVRGMLTPGSSRTQQIGGSHNSNPTPMGVRHPFGGP